ncbi:hypothetical protein N9Y17_02565 [Gammaproteobacteria bacterium]|nr:hypothetical protein [Gammaproteobacteria bacterium]
MMIANIDPHAATLERKIARGKRLATLRKMVASRKDFASKYEISTGTLQNWERARFGGLTESGVDRMLEILKKEDITATYEWIWLGIGKGPVFSSLARKQKEKSTKKQTINYEDALSNELEKLRSMYPNLTHTIVDSTDMIPHFLPGDTVAGVKVFGDDIEYCDGKYCIIEDEMRNKRVRLIRKSSLKDRFHLQIVNESLEKEVIETNVKLTNAAQIFWTRREEF